VRHAVNLQRYEVNAAKNSLAELTRLDKMLTGLIVSHNPNARMTSLLAQARKEINAAVKAARNVSLKSQDIVILQSMEASVAAMNLAIGAPVVKAIATASFVSTVKSKSLTMGAPAVEWWSRQAGTTYARFADTVRSGFMSSRNTGDIIEDWKIVSKQQQSHVEAQVRTSLNSLANNAKEELYRRNEDVTKGLQAQVTLDLRTSSICRSRSGYAWDYEGKAINEITDIAYPGPPPWHWNCRTILVPIMKSFDELGIEVKGKIPPSTQASMDGQVPEALTYDDWFKGLAPDRQLEVLGPKKLKLYKEKKLSMRDMVDQSGNELTLDQLKKAS
jgi:hypothetical protein